MNGTYFLCLLAGALVCSGLFAWRLRGRGVKPLLALVALPIAVVLAATLSKAVYFLAKLPEQLDNYGLGGLLRTRPAEFSFVGGCIGVVLAVIIAARLLKKPALMALDAFAPCGALMACIVRLCEGLLDPMSMVGVGDFVANDKMWFFPVAVEPMPYSWFYAVFMLEAVCALVVAVMGFILSRKDKFAPGRVGLQTALFLALPQIFCEDMLGQCTRWGFVRVEQLLCAVIVFAVILAGCIRAKWFLPALLDLLCVGGIIWLLFTLDNKPPFGLEMPANVCYGLMILILICMAALAQWAFRKADKTA